MTVLAIDSGMNGGVAHKLTKFAETGPFSDGREGEWRNAREDQKKCPRVTAPTTSGRFSEESVIAAAFAMAGFDLTGQF